MSRVVLTLTLLMLTCFSTTYSQGTSFNYQGSIKEGGVPGNGSFQMQFKLFDAPTGGTQIGSTITNSDVTVTDGVFSIRLDFGSSPFSGADRFLEIAVRRNSAQSYTILSPRQQIASSPYSIRTVSAAQADVAIDSQKLGGVNANEYVTTSTDSFIRNSALAVPIRQTGGFGVTGNAWIGGSLGLGGTLNTATKLTISGQDAIRIYGFQPFITFQDGNNDNKSARIQSADGKLIFRPDNPPNSIPAMVIEADGRVGIGPVPDVFGRLSVDGGNSTAIVGESTDTAIIARGLVPSSRAGLFVGPVEISGNSSVTRPALDLALGAFWTSNAWRGQVRLDTGGAFGWAANSAGWRFGVGQSNGGLYFFRTASAVGNTSSPAIYDMVITDAGRVGVNTTTPDANLSVNGTASKTNGGSWANFSDERLKNINGSFARGLDAVMQLEPIRYELRNDNELGLKADGEQIGFSAQAVERVLPEAVIKNDRGYLLVNNDPIIWAMLNAIKEQQAQIEELRRALCSDSRTRDIPQCQK